MDTIHIDISIQDFLFGLLGFIVLIVGCIGLAKALSKQN